MLNLITKKEFINEFKDYLRDNKSISKFLKLRLQNNKKYFEVLEELTPDLLDLSYNERLFLMLGDIKKPYCLCQKELHFRSFKLGYRKYCSKSCASNSIEVKEKKKRALIDKYRITNQSQLSQIKVPKELFLKDLNKKIEKHGLTYIARYLRFLRVDNELYRDILNRFNLNLYRELTVGEKLFYILNNLKEVPKCYCGNYLKFISITEGYRKYCSVICSLKSEERKNRDFIVESNNFNVKPSILSKQEIFDFCKQHFEIVQQDKKIDELEFGLFLPEIKLGIEIIKLRQHEPTKNLQFYQNKMLKAKEKEIQLISVFEDEWWLKQDIVSSILLSKMGKIKNKTFARKCEIKVVNSKLSKEFYSVNHLQGFINGFHTGLFNNGELIASITFGKSRFNKSYEYEILRFCGKINTNIVGGLSRLIKHFIKTYHPRSIITYVDARYGTGEGYLNSGFKYKGLTTPGYFYTDFSRRESRIKYQKYKLKNIFTKFDSKLTEWQNMQLNGFDRVWDAGNYIYEFLNIQK